MHHSQTIQRMEDSPVIAAVHDSQWDRVLHSPVEIIFYLDANLLTIKDRVERAHNAGKALFVHVDLANGIAKDKTAVEYLANCGVDGILSTRPQMIRRAKECGIVAVQRFFVVDSQGINSIREMIKTSAPHIIEIMPGVITKVIKQFRKLDVPVIAGGLLETKAEVTAALGSGASGVSTSREELWYL